MKRWLVILSLLFSVQSFAWSIQEIRRILNPQNTLYEVLQIKPDASDKEIRTACRRLVRAYHPDLFPTNSREYPVVTEVIKKINLSRKTLLDPRERNAYNSTIPKSRPTKTSVYSQKTESQETSSARKANEARRARELQEAAKARDARESWRVNQANNARWADSEKWTPKKINKPNKSAPPKEQPVSQQEVKTPDVKAETAAERSSSLTLEEKAKETNPEPKGISKNPYAEQGIKAYEATSKCGTGYFEKFVDVLL
ncbi:MAG TPA: DnaJ domain-containing protein [Pseudobdellovibrionaceae bacterium]|jgi:curved DNA-binding protein CbpA